MRQRSTFLCNACASGHIPISLISGSSDMRLSAFLPDQFAPSGLYPLPYKVKESVPQAHFAGYYSSSFLKKIYFPFTFY